MVDQGWRGGRLAGVMEWCRRLGLIGYDEGAAASLEGHQAKELSREYSGVVVVDIRYGG